MEFSFLVEIFFALVLRRLFSLSSAKQIELDLELARVLGPLSFTDSLLFPKLSVLAARDRDKNRSRNIALGCRFENALNGLLLLFLSGRSCKGLVSGGEAASPSNSFEFCSFDSDLTQSRFSEPTTQDNRIEKIFKLRIPLPDSFYLFWDSNHPT